MGIVAILIMWPGRLEHIFVSANPESYIWNTVKTGLRASEEMFEIGKLWWVLGQRSNNDLDLFFS